MTIRILIVGLGNIGERHLQGVIEAAQVRPIEIVCVERSVEKVQNIKLRYGSATTLNLKVFPSLISVKGHFDLVIVATLSDSRFEAVLEMAHRSIDWQLLLLEKIPFASLTQYSRFRELYNDRLNKVFVNCPRGLWKGYKKIRSIVQNESLKSLKVTGSDWGICSNSMHFYALALWLDPRLSQLPADAKFSNISRDDYSSELQSPDRWRAKLYGCLEFYLNEAPVQISLEDRPGVTREFSIDLEFTDTKVRINERTNTCAVIRDGCNVSQTHFETSLVSTVTADLVDCVERTGDLRPLPTFEDLYCCSEAIFYAFESVVDALVKEGYAYKGFLS